MLMLQVRASEGGRLTGRCRPQNEGEAHLRLQLNESTTECPKSKEKKAYPERASFRLDADGIKRTAKRTDEKLHKDVTANFLSVCLGDRRSAIVCSRKKERQEQDIAIPTCKLPESRKNDSFQRSGEREFDSRR